MIGRLSGTLVQKSAEQVIVDVGGVGYELSVPATTLARLPPTGEPCVIVVHTHLREDGITLYGFWSEVDREAFRLLQTVSQVGPRLALGILSGMTVAELVQGVASKNLARFKAVSGVGPKTAERICLELRDKVGALGVSGEGPAAPVATPGAAAASEAVVQVVAALVHMGYRPAEAERAARSARESIGAGASVEALLRDSLARLVG